MEMEVENFLIEAGFHIENKEILDLFMDFNGDILEQLIRISILIILSKELTKFDK